MFYRCRPCKYDVCADCAHGARREEGIEDEEVNEDGIPVGHDFAADLEHL